MNSIRPDVRNGEICVIGKRETERPGIDVPDARYEDQMTICSQTDPQTELETEKKKKGDK